jgi:dihydropteroate synthase
MKLVCGRTVLDLSRPRIMGIVNVTPDSFSDGGQFTDPGRAVAAAWAMVEEGADIIDVGGESTRPGAQPVQLEEERRRVMPVVAALVAELDVPVSIDTSKPEIMLEAVGSGAAIINDVNALRAPGALSAAAAGDAAVCLMHMQGEPRTMQANPRYGDVVTEVRAFLAERVAACAEAGIDAQRVVIDPGFGFGKSLRHNLALLGHLEQLRCDSRPILVGLSRKRIIGELTGQPVTDRTVGSVSLALLAAQQGANIIRVHDVGATRDALSILSAFQSSQSEQA